MRRTPHHALPGRLANPFLARGPVVARHRAADDARRELDAAARDERLDLEAGVAEHAVAAGLPLVAPLRRRLAADRLLVRHPRRAREDLHAELLLEWMHRRVERRLTDAGEDRLVRRVVAAHVERGVLVGELVQRRAELVEVV